MLYPQLHNSGEWGLGPVHTSELLYMFGNISRFDIKGCVDRLSYLKQTPSSRIHLLFFRFAYNPTPEDFYLQKHESRSFSSFVAVGRPSLDGHDTLPGWEKAQFADENYGTYVIGGGSPGYSGTGSTSNAEARAVMAKKEKLSVRCGFLNSPEIVKEMRY